MSYYPNMFHNHYNNYSPVSMYGEPYGRHPHPLPYNGYSAISPMVSMAYHNYYREPNVLNRLLNRARYGTGSYFGNPYMHTRVTFDPQGNRIWPEGNYVSSVKDLWKASDPYADR